LSQLDYPSRPYFDDLKTKNKEYRIIISNRLCKRRVIKNKIRKIEQKSTKRYVIINRKVNKSIRKNRIKDNKNRSTKR
jgi:hypothetical protein